MYLLLAYTGQNELSYAMMLNVCATHTKLSLDYMRIPAHIFFCFLTVMDGS